MTDTHVWPALTPPIDDRTAAEMQLDEWGPMTPEIGTPLDGPMNTRGKEFFRSADGNVYVGIWEVDAGRFRAEFNSDGEMIHVVKGRMTCISDDGKSTSYVAGDTATFTPGWRGIWDIESPMRKFYSGFRIPE